MDEVAVKELLPFLASDARADVKSLALSYILGLSGSDRGKNFLKDNEEYLKGLLDLTMDSNSSISNDAFSVLVNLSAESVITEKLLQFTFLRSFLTYILNPSSDHAEKATMILSNVARSEMGCREVLKVTSSTEDCSLHKIVEVLCLEKYNPKAKLTYLSPFLSNLTQLKESRDFILDRNRCVIQRLLPFTVYKQSVVKRGGIVGALRNCCFETGRYRLPSAFRFQLYLTSKCFFNCHDQTTKLIILISMTRTQNMSKNYFWVIMVVILIVAIVIINNDNNNIIIVQ